MALFHTYRVVRKTIGKITYNIYRYYPQVMFVELSLNKKKYIAKRSKQKWAYEKKKSLRKKKIAIEKKTPNHLYIFFIIFLFSKKPLVTISFLFLW